MTGRRTQFVVGSALFAAVLSVAGAAFGFWSVGVNANPAGSGTASSLVAPVSASASSTGATSISVTFKTPASQLTGGQYKVVRSGGPGAGAVVCGPETVALNTTTSCSDTSLTPGATYTYTVESVIGSAWVAAAATTPSATTGQAPAITSGSSTTFTVGTAGTFSVTTTGSPTNTITDASFTGCTASTLPGGVTFVDNANNTATLAGTPAANTGGTYTACINASNGVGSAATQKFTLTVNQAPAITSSNATTFPSGAAGSFTVTTTGSPTNTITDASFTNCTASTLPAAITFTNNGNNTATIASTSSAASGTYTICVNASNGVGSAATQKFTLTVAPAPTVTITSPTNQTYNSNGSTWNNACKALLGSSSATNAMCGTDGASTPATVSSVTFTLTRDDPSSQCWDGTGWSSGTGCSANSATLVSGGIWKVPLAYSSLVSGQTASTTGNYSLTVTVTDSNGSVAHTTVTFQASS